MTSSGESERGPEQQREAMIFELQTRGVPFAAILVGAGTELEYTLPDADEPTGQQHVRAITLNPTKFQAALQEFGLHTPELRQAAGISEKVEQQIQKLNETA